MATMNPPAKQATTRRAAPRRSWWRWLPPQWQVIAWLVGVAATVSIELQRYLALRGQGSELSAWLVDVNVDTTLPFVLLAVAPIVWLVPGMQVFRRSLSFARSSPWFGASTKPGTDRSREMDWRDWLLACSVAIASLVVSMVVSQTRVENGSPHALGDLPPAYHDEYSYLFMAETFLKGRTWSAGHPTMPELFDQVHVLNEGKMASRYFPGTGLWMAPFVAMGHPYLGHWLAGALCAFFVFWAGRELAGNGVGLLAGLLTAVSPGMAIFSNLLVAHHPTLLGLSLFLFAFLRLIRTAHTTDALLAGGGLAFAMLCRPMTAAAFGLPFGLWLFAWLLRGWGLGVMDFRLTRVASVGAPLLAGLIGMYFYNQSITGKGWVSPYQQYTEIYTPRHVYGFNNVERGERRLGPKVIDDYDRWAENLTPKLAARNVGQRLLSGWQWTLGIVPLLVAAAVFPRYAADHDRRWWLIALAILALHAAHVPYWYQGIMGWHYVFETGPLWLLLFAGSTQGLLEDWRVRSRGLMPFWWAGLALVALLPQYVVMEPLWWVSRGGVEIQNLSFSRFKHAAVEEAVGRYVEEQPALVLVSQGLHELHIDYVINDPGLSEAVLMGRLRSDETDLAAVLRTFPERTLYAITLEEGELAATAQKSGLRVTTLGSFLIPPGQVAHVSRITSASDGSQQ